MWWGYWKIAYLCSMLKQKLGPTTEKVCLCRRKVLHHLLDTVWHRILTDTGSTKCLAIPAPHADTGLHRLLPSDVYLERRYLVALCRRRTFLSGERGIDCVHPYPAHRRGPCKGNNKRIAMLFVLLFYWHQFQTSLIGVSKKKETPDWVSLVSSFAEREDCELSS